MWTHSSLIILVLTTRKRQSLIFDSQKKSSRRFHNIKNGFTLIWVRLSGWFVCEWVKELITVLLLLAATVYYFLPWTGELILATSAIWMVISVTQRASWVVKHLTLVLPAQLCHPLVWLLCSVLHVQIMTWMQRFGIDLCMYPCDLRDTPHI